MLLLTTQWRRCGVCALVVVCVWEGGGCVLRCERQFGSQVDACSAPVRLLQPTASLLWPLTHLLPLPHLPGMPAHLRSLEAVVAVDLFSGAVTRVTPANGASWSLVAMHDGGLP